MKKSWVILSVIITTGILLYFLIFSFLIPKTAVFAIPFKWRRIPVKQSRTIAIDYLGRPFQRDTGSNPVKEKWVQGSKGRAFILELDYRDSIVTGYSIRYQFNNKIVSRNYLLDTFSIR